MNFGNGSSTAWKEIAEEKQQHGASDGAHRHGVVRGHQCPGGGRHSRRQSNYSNLCSYVGERHASDVAEYKETELTEELLTDYCS